MKQDSERLDAESYLAVESRRLNRVTELPRKPSLGTASSLVELRHKGEGKLTGVFGRWARLGPYYAMFPMEFAVATVKNYSRLGGWVLDPFAGRGTGIFAAAASGRNGTGIEIQPAGWLYGQVKLNPVSHNEVLLRLRQLVANAKKVRPRDLTALPEFFHWCFAPGVLRFLIAARRELNWVSAPSDRTLMAFVLTYLHGAAERSLSNQMRQAKAMAPDYSVRWWKRNQLRPFEKDVQAFLEQRINWRYRDGAPSFCQSQIHRGDATRILSELSDDLIRYDMLFTSPPYFDVCNYHSDQWLRLWVLGGGQRPVKEADRSTGSFQSMPEYRALLFDVFSKAAALMKPGAAIYVRTDAREFTLATTHAALRNAFPGRRIRRRNQPFEGQTQTKLYGDKEKKPGEVDLIISATRSLRYSRS